MREDGVNPEKNTLRSFQKDDPLLEMEILIKFMISLFPSLSHEICLSFPLIFLYLDICWKFLLFSY